MMIAACHAAPPAATCAAPRDTCDWSAVVAASQCGGDDGSVQYRSSTAEQLAIERSWLRDLLIAAPRGRAAVDALAPAATAQGLQLVVCERMAIVIEQPTQRRGRGAYVVALGDARELLIEIPHSFSDLHTLPMGRELFAATNARALAVSTVHRRGQAGYGDDDRRVPPKGHADVAHDANSMFQALTVAWVEAFPGALVVQLHGFADHRVDADIVLSTGAKTPAPGWAREVRERLRALVSGRTVALFPDDVDELGATTNSQGRAIRAANGRFLHIEMAGSLRDSLRRRAGDRERFIAGLGGALLAPSR